MKKGFTLIELLAVIIILAVIALITTPIVLNVVDEAKKSAARDSAYGFADAARLHFVETEFKVAAGDKTATSLKNGKVDATAITVKGTKPTGTCEVSYGANGEVSFECEFNTYTYKYENGEATLVTASGN